MSSDYARQSSVEVNPHEGAGRDHALDARLAVAVVVLQLREHLACRTRTWYSANGVNKDNFCAFARNPGTVPEMWSD